MPARVMVATPRRFMKVRRLAEPNDGIRMMLEFIRRVQDVCERRGLACHLMASEDIPRTVRDTLVFSHHTYRDGFFGELEKAGNQVWHYKAADLPQTMVVDRGGFSGWSSVADLTMDGIPSAPREEVEAFFEGSRAAVRASNVSKYAQTAMRGHIGAGRPYVFVALQTKNDIVQRHAYVPMLDMLQMVVDRFLGTDWDVVIKRHPRCKDEEVDAAIRRQLAKGRTVRLTDASIHDILNDASALFTVNSGVGSEAMAYGVPIYCFGKSDYAPVAHQVRSAGELADTTSPIRLRQGLADHKHFLHFYRTVYQVKAGDDLLRRIDRIVGEFPA